jgi:transcriptional regulator with XRE-family HTH domain
MKTRKNKVKRATSPAVTERNRLASAIGELAVRCGGAAELARRVGTTRQTVDRWLHGTRAPRAADLRRLQREGLGAEPAPSIATPTDSPGTPRPREELERLLAIVRVWVEAAHADRRVSWRERSQLANAATSCARALARISGQEEPNDSQFLRSKIWRRIVEAMGPILSRFPDASAELSAALEQIGAMQ